MTLPWDLLVAAALLVVNRVVPGRHLGRLGVYVGLQVVDLAALLWFLVHGVDGLSGFRVAGWAISGLFAMHLVTNASRRSVARRDDRPPWLPPRD